MIALTASVCTRWVAVIDTSSGHAFLRSSQYCFGAKRAGDATGPAATSEMAKRPPEREYVGRFDKHKVLVVT